MLVTYYGARHVFGDTDHALAVIIARQLGFNLERRRVEDALRMTQRQLEAELAATRHLQSISTQLIRASDVEALYEKILDAAVAIMCSDFASMQMFYPERGELRLLAYRGFSRTSAAFWEWVKPASACTTGRVMYPFFGTVRRTDRSPLFWPLNGSKGVGRVWRFPKILAMVGE